MHFEIAPGYVGCFRDDIFNDNTRIEDFITIEKCLRLVRTQSSRDGSVPYFAGTQAGNQCWYNLKNQGLGRRRGDSECSVACGGNPDQICGKNNRISVYDGKFCSFCP